MVRWRVETVVKPTASFRVRMNRCTTAMLPTARSLEAIYNLW